jgi:hypothetical protein
MRLQNQPYLGRQVMQAGKSKVTASSDLFREVNGAESKDQ